MKSKSIVYSKAFSFSIRIVHLYKYLSEEKREWVLSRQVLRSGTSVGANVKEALYAQSKKDYISKMNIALKEAGETEYWIELLIETEYINEKLGKSLLEDCVEIIKMLVSIIKTSRNNGQPKTINY